MTTTDLISSVRAGDASAVTRLLASNPAIEARDDEKGWTPAAYAAALDHDEILHLLLGAGASLELPKDASPDGGTLLHIAAWFGSPKCVRLLLARGVPADQRDATRQTPLMYAASGATFGPIPG